MGGRQGGFLTAGTAAPAPHGLGQPPRSPVRSGNPPRAVAVDVSDPARGLWVAVFGNGGRQKPLCCFVEMEGEKVKAPEV